jgi:DNA polymerase (family 10)
MYWAEADVYANALREHLQACKSIKQLELAGSYRRGRETIGDLDVLAESSDPAEVMDRLATFDGIDAVLGRGETKMSIRLANGLQIDLRIVDKEAYGAALVYFTGSKAHNIVLRGMAKDRGLKINEYGVFRVGGTVIEKKVKGKKTSKNKGDLAADPLTSPQRVLPDPVLSPSEMEKVGARGEEAEETVGVYLAGWTEKDVYATLDLPWIPPELREDRWEFKWAAEEKIPKLVEASDMQGDLHMHTTATDGKATLEEMVTATAERGLKYIAITDHSQRTTIANGMTADRLRRQWEEIDKLNEKLRDFVVLKGVEVDILEKGPLDLDDDCLSQADWVVASVHFGQNQPREQITKRIVDALANPNVCAIAHPTGRIINRRKPYDVDLEAVCEAAIKYRKFLELNSNPARLDLDDIHCAACRERGIPVVISTDAHSVQGLDVVRYGILQARRAGLTKNDVANTRPWKDVKKLLGRK